MEALPSRPDSSPVGFRLQSRWIVAVAMLAAGTTGAALAQGSIPSFVFAGVVSGAALLVIVGRLGIAALLLWAGADEVLAPFLRFPTARAVITFDRVWLLACLATLVFTHRSLAFSRPVRLLLVAFSIFGFEYGVNAIITFISTGDITAPTIWVDTYVLASITFLVTTWLMTDRSHLRKLIIALTIGAVINSLIGISEQIYGYSFAANYNTVSRQVFGSSLLFISGGFEGPEQFAMSLLVAEAGALYLLQTVRGKLRRLLATLALIIICVGTALTILRSAWVAEVIVAVISLTFRPRRRSRLFWITVAVIGIGIVASLQFSQDSAPSPTTEAFQRHTFSNEDFFSRLATYRQGWNIFLTNPLFGVGVQQYMPNALRAPIEVVGGHASVPEAHNSFIGVLAEQGVVGFALFLFLILAGWRMLAAAFGSARDPHDQALVACAIGASVAYLFMSLVFQMLPMAPSNAFLALLLGCVAARLDAIRSNTDPVEPGSQPATQGQARLTATSAPS